MIVITLSQHSLLNLPNLQKERSHWPNQSGPGDGARYYGDGLESQVPASKKYVGERKQEGKQTERGT